MCYNPPTFSLLAPPPAAPPSHSTQPTITITQSSPPVPLQPPWTSSIPRPPMPPIPWSQHVRQYSSMELYQEPSPEPVQELQDSDMSSPGPSPVISHPEPLSSPHYIVTEPFTPYQHTSPPECHHNTHKLSHTERPSQPSSWREHLAYSPPQEHKCSISPSSIASPSQHMCLLEGGYATPDISPTMEHPYSFPPSQAPSPLSQVSLMQSSAGSPEQPAPPPS